MNAEINNKRFWYILTFVTALAGLTVSLYLAYTHYMIRMDESFSSLCNLGGQFNCDLVASSDYSKLFGVPVPVWGFCFYAFFLVTTGLRLFGKRLPNLAVYHFWFALMGVGFSAYLAYISKIVIEAWCLFCMISWSLTLMVLLWSVFCLEKKLREHVAVFAIGFGWLVARPSRILKLLVIGSVCFVSVGYAWNLELERLAAIQKQAPKFTVLTQPISLTGPAFGSDDPRLTIIEFSDFQCPHCKHLHHDLLEIVKEFKDVRVVHKDYPLDHQCHPSLKRPFHVAACEAARFVRCAGAQGKYWEAAALLFDQQKKLKEADVFSEFQKTLGLVADSLELCIEAEETKTELLVDINEGVAQKFQGTPVIVFDGERQLTSPWTQGRLKKIVRDELKSLK